MGFGAAAAGEDSAAVVAAARERLAAAVALAEHDSAERRAVPAPGEPGAGLVVRAAPEPEPAAQPRELREAAPVHQAGLGRGAGDQSGRDGQPTRASSGSDRDIVGNPIGREALLSELEYEMVAYTPEELLEAGGDRDEVVSGGDEESQPRNGVWR